MPILEINVAQIASPTRLQCAFLEGLMLWPDDAEKRATVGSTTEREFGKELLRGFGEGELPLPADAWLAFIERTSKGPPLNAVQADALPRFVQGFICGTAILEIVGGKAIGGAPPRNEVLTRIIAHMSVGGLVLGQRVSADYLNRTRWDAIKPVLHLWAAFVSHSLSANEGAFPCRAARLPNFLAESEWWLGAAANLRPTRASTNLLDLGDAWRPAPDVLAFLPPMEISPAT